MTTKLTIYYSGFTERGSGSGDELKTRKIPATVVSPSGTRNLDVKPNDNIGGPVEAETLAAENLRFPIKAVKLLETPVGASIANIGWEDVLTLYQMKYNGTNAPILNVTYGDSIQLVGLEGSTDIKVVLEDFNFDFDPTSYRDAYLPEGTLTFRETK